MFLLERTPKAFLKDEELAAEPAKKLIGDASHRTTPQLASGAGMRIEEALVLAEELARSESIEETYARFHGAAHRPLPAGRPYGFGQCSVPYSPACRFWALLCPIRTIASRPGALKSFLPVASQRQSDYLDQI